MFYNTSQYNIETNGLSYDLQTKPHQEEQDYAILPSDYSEQFTDSMEFSESTSQDDTSERRRIDLRPMRWPL